MARVKIEYKDVPSVPLKEVIIHDVYILDASGSMGRPSNRSTKAGMAIEGCVSNLSEIQKNVKPLICVFSDCEQIFFIDKVGPQLEKNIRSHWKSNMTALYDAIGQTMVKLENTTRRGELANIKIFTDGGENGSRNFSKKQIKALIKQAETKNWTVSFVGTSFDVENVKRNLGIDASNTLVHDDTAEGFTKVMAVTKSAMATYSMKASQGEDVSFGFYKNLKD